MTVQRTVKIIVVEECPYDVGMDKEIHAAVGYLSSWAIHSANKTDVIILIDRLGFVNATYRDSQGNVTYSMGGCRREDGTYSYHS